MRQRKIALLAAAVLLVAVGCSASADAGTETEAAAASTTTTTLAPTTTATTTTTVVDIVSADERAAADAVVAALNTNSTADLYASMTESGSVSARIQKSEFSGISRSRDLLDRYLSLDFALGTTWTIMDCDPASTSTSLRCALDVYEPLRDALEFGTLPALLLIDVGDDGLIRSLDLRWDSASTIALGSWVEDLAVFTDWVDGNYPGDLNIMTTELTPLTSPASVALWEQHVAEFLDTRD